MTFDKTIVGTLGNDTITGGPSPGGNHGLCHSALYHQSRDWQRVAFTYDGSANTGERGRIYINGSLQMFTPIVDPGGIPLASARPLPIGDQEGTAVVTFIGLIV
jgi:hypothetical protein